MEDDARVHLEVFGETRAVDLRVPIGAVPVRALLPVARELGARVRALAEEQAAAEGRTVSCSAGCAACCRQLVPISPVEARAVAEAVDALPPREREATRARFAGAVRRMEQIRLLDRKAPRGRSALRASQSEDAAAWREVSARYFAAQIACPLLVDERCSLYESRPEACREYLVTTPTERCRSLDGGAEEVARPIRMSEALASAAASLLAWPSSGMIPLALALEWSEVHGAALDATVDGEAAFLALVEAAQASEG